MIFVEHGQNWNDFDLFGDILESLDFIFALENGNKTAAGSALNSKAVTTIRKLNANNNNNKPGQH